MQRESSKRHGAELGEIRMALLFGLMFAGGGMHKPERLSLAARQRIMLMVLLCHSMLLQLGILSARMAPFVLPAFELFYPLGSHFRAERKQAVKTAIKDRQLQRRDNIQQRKKTKLASKIAKVRLFVLILVLNYERPQKERLYCTAA